jgi:hypothetical protein
LVQGVKVSDRRLADLLHPAGDEALVAHLGADVEARRVVGERQPERHLAAQHRLLTRLSHRRFQRRNSRTVAASLVQPLALRESLVRLPPRSLQLFSFLSGKLGESEVRERERPGVHLLQPPLHLEEDWRLY